MPTGFPRKANVLSVAKMFIAWVVTCLLFFYRPLTEMLFLNNKDLLHSGFTFHTSKIVWVMFYKHVRRGALRKIFFPGEFNGHDNERIHLI